MSIILSGEQYDDLTSRLEAAESRSMEWAKVADDARKAKMLAESELRKTANALLKSVEDRGKAESALTEALDAIEEWREQRGRATVQSDDEANDLWLVAVANRIRSQIEGSKDSASQRELKERRRREGLGCLIEGSNDG